MIGVELVEFAKSIFHASSPYLTQQCWLSTDLWAQKGLVQTYRRYAVQEGRVFKARGNFGDLDTIAPQSTGLADFRQSTEVLKSFILYRSDHVLRTDMLVSPVPGSCQSA